MENDQDGNWPSLMTTLVYLWCKNIIDSESINYQLSFSSIKTKQNKKPSPLSLEFPCLGIVMEGDVLTLEVHWDGIELGAEQIFGWHLKPTFVMLLCVNQLE